MKILYLHQYFRTPQEAGSHRSWYITQAFVRAGHQVEVITSFCEKTSKTLEIEGIIIHYVPVAYEQSMGFGRRLFAFLLFFIKAFIKAFSIKNVHLVYATSTPLSVGVLAFFIKKFKRLPYIFEVRDLWPLVPIEMGFIRNSLAKKFFFYIEKLIYKHATQIVALSPPMQSYIAGKVSQKEILCVPNISDCEFFTPNISSDKKTFTIAYFGSVGKANALERFVQLAKNISNIRFWVIGKGSELPSIKSQAKELLHFEFFEEQPKSVLKKTLENIDAVYISFADFKSLETCSPNKFFDGLAAGKLCITNTKGWIKELIEQETCGFYAENEVEFLLKIAPFLENPSLLESYQQNARRVAEKYFEKNHLCSKIVSLIEATKL